MNGLSTLDRYAQTLRWLRPVQFYGRVRFRLARPRVDTAAAPDIRRASVPWVLPARRRPSLTAPGSFLFLNEPGDLAECGWDDPARAKLWRYNQHYFDDINALDAPARRDFHSALIVDWLARNPPGSGTGWEPYPTSLRIVNWIKWALAGNELSDAARQSLAIQARWLMRRLEWHLLGNHLFANGKALIFAGLWFEGEEAQQWLGEGLSILAREMREQVLSDGGQFELSPMYHALALEDVLDLVNVTRCFASALSRDQRRQSEAWVTLIPAMQRWLAALSHPDGGIAFFNDAAFGIAPDNAELAAYAARLALPAPGDLGPLTWLPDSGYARLAQPDAVLIVDLARIGPDYLPGHAHADTLSFELSVRGCRLFVNSGTSVYGTGSERQRQRSTPAHNTVTVASRNSSDVWSGFRVGRRAVPRDRRVERDGEVMVAATAHDGYLGLPGRPLHHRVWRLSPKGLRVEDSLGVSRLDAEARFHLHPDVGVQQQAAQAGELRLPTTGTVTWRAEGGPVRLEPATWHPEFGLSRPSSCLVVPLCEGRAALDVSWT